MTQLATERPRTHGEKLLYTAKVHTTGGRDHGVARSSQSAFRQNNSATVIPSKSACRGCPWPRNRPGRGGQGRVNNT